MGIQETRQVKPVIFHLHPLAAHHSRLPYRPVTNGRAALYACITFCFLPLYRYGIIILT